MYTSKHLSMGEILIVKFISHGRSTKSTEKVRDESTIVHHPIVDKDAKICCKNVLCNGCNIPSLPGLSFRQHIRTRT